MPDIRRQIGKMSYSNALLQDAGPGFIWQVFTALKFCPVQSNYQYEQDQYEFTGHSPYFNEVPQGLVCEYYDPIFHNDTIEETYWAIEENKPAVQATREVSTTIGIEVNGSGILILPEWDTEDIETPIKTKT